MKSTLCATVCLLLGAPAPDFTLPAATAAAPGASPSARSADVLAHLELAISWYRQVKSLEQSAGLSEDVFLQDSLKSTSVKAIQLAFEFARGEAALLSFRQAATVPEGETGAVSGGRNVEQMAARAANRVAKIQSRINELDSAVDRARPRIRDVLVAQRKELLAELKLAKQIQESVRGLTTFVGSLGQASGAGGGLPQQIERLARSLPEAEPGTGAAAASRAVNVAQASASPMFHPQSTGIFGLATELFSIARSRMQLNHAIDETDGLLKNIDTMRAPLATELRNAIRRSDATASAAISEDPEQLAAAQREVEALTSRFKLLSGCSIPLREEGLVVEAIRGNLLEWQSTLSRRYNTTGGYLLARTVALGAVILVLLIISELWRRGTFRYVRDARRRRQFLLLRRIVVTFAIVLVIALSFVREMGSLATYAGFLTAGLAVALQNVILSVVAYFSLIGRYGLRIGDRVTISGVTGDVIEIGLVRIYLMEMAGTDGDLHATGRVVAFSNSVLFQPSALFKRMPGTDYLWHTATLKLAPESDFQLAETSLMAAVNAVYEEYRENIERQHAAFERSVDMKVSAPQPEGRLRFSEGVLEFSVRYPVEIRGTSTIDDRVMKALHSAVANEPRLMPARAGTPKVEATSTPA